jgi:hypothetical protein
MKKKIFAFALSVLFVLPAVRLSAADDGLTGLQIADKIEASNVSSKGLVTKAVLELKNIASQDAEKRGCIMESVSENGLKKAAFRFTDSSYRGTTFLTLDKDGGDKITYIYLASVGSPRQIEASDRENNFVDTDFSNEDLGGSNTADYTYTRLADKKIGDMDCYFLEKAPKNKSSKYSKYQMLVDKTSFIPVMVKAFDKTGRLVKTIKMDNIKKVSESIYVPYGITVVDVDKKHSSVITVTQAAEKQVNKGNFNKNKMDMKWPEE